MTKIFFHEIELFDFASFFGLGFLLIFWPIVHQWGLKSEKSAIYGVLTDKNQRVFFKYSKDLGEEFFFDILIIFQRAIRRRRIYEKNSLC